MERIRDFLTQEFLPRRDCQFEPDGRLLYLYMCDDQEFEHLIDLLRESGAPSGHDFDDYRKRWRRIRKGFRIGGRQHSFDALETRELDWTVRGFVLYASEFWRRFRNEEWRQRRFPDRLPFKKLTWLQFLSLVGWTDLYREKVAGYVEVQGTPYRVAHASNRHVDASEFDDAEKNAGYSSLRGNTETGHYPGLYFPMLAAWNWWKVAPVRLPSSIRYLDTFAHQGGAEDRLVVEFSRDFETDSEVVYRPVRPPKGYGINDLHIERDALPTDADLSELNVTLLFGPHAGSRGE